MKLLFSIACSFVFFQLGSQSLAKQSLDKYQNDYLPEKIFVHTDKGIYAPGETIFMAAYLVDGITHQLGSPSKIIRIELLDPKGVIVKSIRVLAQEGQAAASIQVPKNSYGTHRLLAYTNHQRNGGEEYLFSKEIKIIEPTLNDFNTRSEELSAALITAKSANQASIKFFPEGGDCIEGIPCRVGFVYTQIGANKRPILGHLTDQKGTKLIELEADKHGYGSFTYVPKSEQDFQVQLSDSENKFPLPKALKNGYHIHLKMKWTRLKY